MSFEPSTICDSQWVSIDALRLYPLPGANATDPARLSGVVHVRRPLDRAVWINNKIGRKFITYNYTYDVIFEDVCAFIEHQDSYSVDTQPRWNGCPLQEGEYNVSDVIFNPMQYTFPGEYWMELHLIHPDYKEYEPPICSATLRFEVLSVI